MNAAPAENPEPAGAAEAFPWDAAMDAGLGLLRLPPAVFWRMTPREFLHAIRPLAGAREPTSRAALAALIQRFPDKH